MGDTYTRQSSYTDGDVITAAHTNDEFNQIVAAFAVSSGHTHDGTAAEGGPITKLLGNGLTFGAGTAGTDITITFDGETNDGVFKWMEDEDYFEFSDDILIASTEKIQFRDTAIYINSSVDGQLDIVADTEIQIAATTIDINGAVALNGAITGATNITLSGELDAATLDISGNADIDGNLDVGGNLTVTGTTTFNGGTLTLGDSAADNIVFGADVDSNIIPDDDDTYDLGSASQEWRNLYIDGTANIDSLVADTADINGGTIDAAVIGGSSAAAASVTTLAASGAITGSSTVQGTTVTATTAFVPGTSDGATLGTTSLEFGDLFLADSSVIYLGADQDVTLTHVPDTGILLNSTNKIQFNDASQFIHGSSATVLSIGATAEIDLTATAIDINGTVDMSSTLATGGLYTAGAGITSTAAANTLGATSFNDADITNVGSLALDSIGADGSVVTFTSPITVGANDAGHDVILYGDTASANVTWDTSVDDLIFSGAAGLIVPEGQLTLGSTAVSSTAAELNKLDGANVTTTEINYLDVTTLGTSEASKAVTVDSSGDLLVPDSDKFKFGAGSDMQLYHDGTNSYVTNATGALKIATETSGIAITLGHSTSEVTVADNLTVTGDLTVSGATTTVATTNLVVADPLVKYGNTYVGSANDQGFIVTRGDGSSTNTQNRGFIWDESADEFATIAANTEAGTTAGNVTINDYAPLHVGAITADDASTFTAGASFGDANITNVGNIALDSITADGSTITITGNTTFADGAYDFDIASHDTSNGLKLGGTLVSATAAEINKLDGVTATTAELNILAGVNTTAAELNKLDGGTSATSTTIVDADRVVLNDNGTIVQVAVSDFKTYIGAATADDATALAIALG
jgi:hypothetical protein